MSLVNLYGYQSKNLSKRTAVSKESLLKHYLDKLDFKATEFVIPEITQINDSIVEDIAYGRQVVVSNKVISLKLRYNCSIESEYRRSNRQVSFERQHERARRNDSKPQNEV